MKQRWPQYGSPRYKRARAALLAGSPKCHWCGGVATTADHLPSLEEVGEWHWSLVPACAPCNYGRRGRVSAGAVVVAPSRQWR